MDGKKRAILLMADDDADDCFLIPVSFFSAQFQELFPGSRAACSAISAPDTYLDRTLPDTLYPSTTAVGDSHSAAPDVTRRVGIAVVILIDLFLRKRGDVM